MYFGGTIYDVQEKVWPFSRYEFNCLKLCFALPGDDSLYFQSRQLEANDEYVKRKIEKYSV